MRIALLGAAGQLGRDLFPRLAPLGEVIALSRAEIDLAQHATIANAVQKLAADVLINCAAYNFVDKAEAEPEAAFAVNAHGVATLAKACHTARTKLIQFSTDYVFGADTARTTPYREDETPGPVSVYGHSKREGELATLAGSANNLVIRVCGLYGVWGSGGKGGNFVETMLRVAGQGKPLRVVNDQRCTPTYTADVATATVSLIQHAATGIYHITNSGDCSWCEFAAEIFRQSNLSPSLTPITTAEFGAAAQRPLYSVLAHTKLAALQLPAMRDWRSALTAYLAERQNKPA